MVKHRMPIHPLAEITRLNKPIGSWLLLWPTWIGLAASGQTLSFQWTIWIVFTLGALLMRAAGCICNDLADRRFDGFVERTKERPLITGRVTPRQAWSLAIALLAMAFFLVLMTNTLTIMLAVGALIIALLYPFAKRVTHLAQFVLGAAFAWPIPMAYAAQRQDFSIEALYLFFAIYFWVVLFDTQYALVDRADDIKINVKSTARLATGWEFIFLSACLAASFAAWTLFGLTLELGWRFYSGLAVMVTACLIQFYMMKDLDKGKCFEAFKAHHYIGFGLFLNLLFALHH